MGKNNKTNSYTDFYYHLFRNILLVSVPLAVISFLALGFVPHSSAENSSADNIRINLPTSCTLSGNVTTEHTASMVSGQELRNIGTTEINTICNDKDGYLVYAKGTTQNSLGEVVLASNLGSNYDIKTGNIPSSSGDSSWAMKLSLGTSTFPPTIVSDYDNKYVPVPNEWTKIAYRDSSTATNSTATSIFTTTYAVYTTPGQPAGTYSGQVKYVMLHPSTTTVVPTNTLEQAFASAGKSKKTGVVDPVTEQTGSFYRMQDMNSSICEAVTPNDSPGYDEIQLVDDRDNKIYWVAKLKDGHCWMTQNLDLDLGVKDTALGIDTTVLTSNDTDLNDSSMSGAYKENYEYNKNTEVITWRPANTTYSYATASGTPWKNNNDIAYSADPGKWYWDGDDDTTACNYLTNVCEHFSQTTDNTHLNVGNYYNWAAAIASDDKSSLTTSTLSKPFNNPQNSICPKGWRLPIVSDSSNYSDDFNRLNNTYNKAAATTSDANLIKSPLWFVRSGNIDSSAVRVGYNAYYFSSTIAMSGRAFTLLFRKGYVQTRLVSDDYHSMASGRSVRCVAR